VIQIFSETSNDDNQPRGILASAELALLGLDESKWGQIFIIEF
jgi:hypothetical protein